MFVPPRIAMHREQSKVLVNWRILIALNCMIISGCGTSQAPLAGGRPISHWVQALNDPNPKVRKEAAFKLGNVGASDASVIPALIAALKDSDSQGRRADAA